MTTDSIISKVWSFCNTLRDDGVGYGDYLEQLTYLIFLKMADEYAKPPYNRPARFGWTVLRPLKGAELEVHYVETLRSLGAVGAHGDRASIGEPIGVPFLPVPYGPGDEVFVKTLNEGRLYSGGLTMSG